MARNISILRILLLLAAGGAAPAAFAQAPVAPVVNPCPRPAAGGVVANPPALYSHHGELTVFFSYQTTQDDQGRTLYCFMTPDGLQNPTLHVQPGDHLVINLTNNVPNSGGMSMAMSSGPDKCGDAKMTAASVNLHYHGAIIPPKCHQDEVIHTIVNSGHSFRYDVAFPNDEPAGLFWYHPHIHGIAEPAVQGGASGAIIVEGIEKFHPDLAGMRERVLLVRDLTVAGAPQPGGDVPDWDLSLNNIPISYPDETPAVLTMKPGATEFWRLGNLSADTILDVQVIYDGVPQPLRLAGIDGIPVGSQRGGAASKQLLTHLRIPPAGRMEFTLRAPGAGVKHASLITSAINTGPDGDNDPARTIANITTNAETATPGEPDSHVPSASCSKWRHRFQGLEDAPPSESHVIYFSEDNPNSEFHITVDNQTPKLFTPNDPPAIVAHQGTVETWTIQNRTMENHEFHLHQVHFLVKSQNHFEINGSQPAPGIQGELTDTVDVPFWDGNPDHPYPSITVLVDFRGPDVGDFVFHCHILEHEDGGMMSIIRVLPH